MNQFSLLFESVASNDREGLIRKGLAAAKILRVFALVAIVFALLIGVPILIGAGFIGGAGLASMDSGFSTGEAVAGGVAIFGLASFLLFIGLIGQIITLWYTGKFKKQLEQNRLPGTGLPIIFLVINLFSVYSYIKPELSIIGLAFSLFIVYLWFTIISVVGKLKNLV